MGKSKKGKKKENKRGRKRKKGWKWWTELSYFRWSWRYIVHAHIPYRTTHRYKISLSLLLSLTHLSAFLSQPLFSASPTGRWKTLFVLPCLATSLPSFIPSHSVPAPYSNYAYSSCPALSCLVHGWIWYGMGWLTLLVAGGLGILVWYCTTRMAP